MEHYVTLFDSLFLPQGLALHASMRRHAPGSTLWVLCVDDDAHRVLTRLALPNLRPLAASKVETDDLRRVKPGRTRAEYCWTLTPFAPRFVFDAAPEVGRVTYLDADMWFCADPAPVFQELDAAGKAVLITEHGYAQEHDYAARAGRFCVQFMPFDRDRGEGVRRWWAERCIEWCFDRVEDGKFGDQRYLDDWPQRFGDMVHVLQRQSLLQAPWNATSHDPCDAVAYHFHGLRLMRGGRVLLTESYRIHRQTYATLYQPYLGDLREAVQTLHRHGIAPRAQTKASSVELRLRILLRSGLAWWRYVRSPRMATL